jgi:polygalacturonase
MLTTTVFATLSNLLLALPPANDLKVPADFGTIQAAVNAAQTNDTITISKGDYSEAVVVDGKTNLTIVGKGKARFVGNFPGSAYLTFTNCTNLSVAGLTFADGNADGVRVFTSTNVTLSKLTILNLSTRGIVLDGCTNVNIE